MSKFEEVRGVLNEIGDSMKRDPVFQLIATPSLWAEEIRELPASLREATEVLHERDPIFRLLDITLGRFLAASSMALLSAVPVLIAAKYLEEPLLEDFYGKSLSPEAVKYCNHMAEGLGAGGVSGLTIAASLIVVPATINLIREWRRPDNENGNEFTIG